MQCNPFSFLFISALALGSYACSEQKANTVQREVSEEAGEIINAIAPDDAKRPAPTAPPALTTPEATVSAIEGAGGLTKLPLAAANETIDLWIGTLSGNDFVDDTDILVERLTQLKAELARQPINKDTVSDILEVLARETKQAADDADNAAVKAIAKALEAGADALD